MAERNCTRIKAWGEKGTGKNSIIILLMGRQIGTWIISWTGNRYIVIMTNSRRCSFMGSGKKTAP